MVLHSHSQVPKSASFFHIAYLAATGVGPQAKGPILAALCIGLLAIRGEGRWARITAGFCLGFALLGGIFFILHQGL